MAVEGFSLDFVWLYCSKRFNKLDSNHQPGDCRDPGEAALPDNRNGCRRTRPRRFAGCDNGIGIGANNALANPSMRMASSPTQRALLNCLSPRPKPLLPHRHSLQIRAQLLANLGGQS